MKVIKLLLAIPVAFALFCVSFYLYCELNKEYWDREVRTLCEKDGGVKIYEKVELSVDEYPELINDRGVLMIPSKSHIKKDDPFFMEDSTEYFRTESPRTYRYVKSIVRASDNKVLSTQVVYGRRGGDFPLGFGPGSNFSCGNNIGDIVFSNTVITRKGI